MSLLEKVDEVIIKRDSVIKELGELVSRARTKGINIKLKSGEKTILIITPEGVLIPRGILGFKRISEENFQNLPFPSHPLFKAYDSLTSRTPPYIEIISA